jgi:GYF domain 2
MHWFYAVNGQTYGPISADELVARMRREPGSVEAVWQEGMPDWIAPEYISEIVQKLRQPPPLPRQPTDPSRPTAAHNQPVGNNFKVEARGQNTETVSAEITDQRASTRRARADRAFRWGFGFGILGAASSLLSGDKVYPPWNTVSGLVYYISLLIVGPAFMGFIFMLFARVGNWRERRSQRLRAQ